MGIAVAIGSVFYWWQARRLAMLENRTDVTALPFGISTPSMFAFAFFILLPEKQAGGDAMAATLFACLWSGIIEAATALYGFLVRMYVPASALISSLSGIAIALIATGSLYQIFEYPMLSMIPFLLFMFATSSRVEIRIPKIWKFPQVVIPWSLLLVVVGTIIFWILYAIKNPEAQPSQAPIVMGFYYPFPAFYEIIQGFRNGAKYAAVMIPLAVINGIGSLQILVSAKNKGDDFDTKSSLLVNGISTVIASCFGAVFPTTIFIGHPTLKEMGARSGYMLLNGIAILIITSFGFVQVFLKFIPTAALLPILVYVGYQMTSEGFFSDDHSEDPECPRRHHLAVAVGISPALSNLTIQAVTNALQIANVPLHTVIGKFASAGFFFGGAIALSQGFLLSSMLLAATVVFWIDREFLKASIVLYVAAALSWIGIIHSYHITPAGIENLFIGQQGNWIAAPGFVVGYAAMGLFMNIAALLQRYLKVWQGGVLYFKDGHHQWLFTVNDIPEGNIHENNPSNEEQLLIAPVVVATEDVSTNNGGKNNGSGADGEPSNLDRSTPQAYRETA